MDINELTIRKRKLSANMVCDAFVCAKYLGGNELIRTAIYGEHLNEEYG